MIWQDLMLDRWVDDSALQAAVAAAFGTAIPDVEIVDGPEQFTSSSDCVLLERTRQERDFPLQVMVVLRDDELAARFAGFDGALRVTTVLADRLGASVLFAEGPLSPATWVRVRPAGTLDLVTLDVDESGDVDSFFVVAARDLEAGLVVDRGAPTRRSA
jgi:hypothetical protein